MPENDHLEDMEIDEMCHSQKIAPLLRTDSWKYNDVLQATKKADLVIRRSTHCDDLLYY